MAEGEHIAVELVWSSAPGQLQRLGLKLPAGASIYQALAEAREQLPPGTLPAAPKSVGILSQLCSQDTPLRGGDRIEIYRELLIDPKDARRKRVGKATRKT